MNGYIGLDIGGTKILGVLYNEDGDGICREKKKTRADEGIDTVMNQIFAVVDTLLENRDISLRGIGAGAPGIIRDEGYISFSPNIPFKDFDMKAAVEKRYGCPFVLGNDVNVGMFGEWKYTGLERAKCVIGLFVGTGIGGAIIINGELLVGQGGAGEMGHMIVNSEGAFCGCGTRGCLEAYASKTAMQKLITAQIKKGRKSSLATVIEEGGVIKSKSLVKAFEEGDSVVVSVIEQSIHYLGIAVASYVNIFHPDIFIFGGGIIEAFGQPILDRIVEEAGIHAMPGLVADVDFRSAELGDDAGVYGGYSLIRSKL